MRIKETLCGLGSCLIVGALMVAVFVAATGGING